MEDKNRIEENNKLSKILEIKKICNNFSEYKAIPPSSKKLVISIRKNNYKKRENLKLIKNVNKKIEINDICSFNKKLIDDSESKPVLNNSRNKLENEDIKSIKVLKECNELLIEKNIIIMVVYENMYIHWHELVIKDIEKCDKLYDYFYKYYKNHNLEILDENDNELKYININNIIKKNPNCLFLRIFK